MLISAPSPYDGDQELVFNVYPFISQPLSSCKVLSSNVISYGEVTQIPPLPSRSNNPSNVCFPTSAEYFLEDVKLITSTFLI